MVTCENSDQIYSLFKEKCLSLLISGDFVSLDFLYTNGENLDQISRLKSPLWLWFSYRAWLNIYVHMWVLKANSQPEQPIYDNRLFPYVPN